MTISASVVRVQKKMNELGSARVPFFFLFDFNLRQAQVIPLSEISTEEILYQFNDYSNVGALTSSNTLSHFKKYPISELVYQRAFQQVKDAIQAGNSYLTNLTMPTRIETNLSLQDIFLQSEAPYRLWLRDQFVCFSPEPFVKIAEGWISSFPMKGTMDANIPDGKERLLADTKESAEHATIVDLIRNDLSRVASKVRVKRYRYLERIKNHQGELWQSSSEISGWLGTGYQEHLGDIFLKLLPAGSISGAPKHKTLEVIQKAEGYDRGYYTGVAGIFDGQSVDSSVLIRFIEKNEEGLFFKSGGGVTAFSDCQLEYDELQQKIYLAFHKREDAANVDHWEEYHFPITDPQFWMANF